MLTETQIAYLRGWTDAARDARRKGAAYAINMARDYFGEDRSRESFTAWDRGYADGALASIGEAL